MELPIKLRIIAAVLVLCIGACAPSKQPEPAPSAGSTIVTNGDWDDLKAAIDYAAGIQEMAFVREVAFQLEPLEVAELPTRRRWFDLVTVGDEPVKLSFRAMSSAQPTDMVITARVGRFGDGPRERQLLDTIKTRLDQLAGVDVAPIK